MIDLHIHTNYSDGKDSLIEVLKKAEENDLEYISITDHENCNVYKELKNINVREYYKGKFIPGVEIKCGYKGRLIELLGYKVDTNKVNELLDDFYKDTTKSMLQQKYFDLLYEKCLAINLKMSLKESIKFDSNRDWASVIIYQEIKAHEENKELLPADLWESFSNFSKIYCSNPDYIFYIDKTVDYPTLQQAIDIIKESEGLVFLPHLFIYKWAENIYELIDDILNNYKIDGIECYHSEFNDDNIKYLLELCKRRNYYMSGGSDYHGTNKRGIEMAVGKGNLKIDKSIIQNWI